MVKRLSSIILIIAIVLLHFNSMKVSATQLEIPTERLKKVDEYIQRQFKEANIVGGTYAIVQKGKIVAAKGIGMSDIKMEKKATPETVYAAASVTKALTATAILQLQEQNKLSINDPVQKYIPWFTYKDKEKSKEITIKHLLTHSPGINRFEADASIFTDEKKNRDSLVNSIKALRTIELSSEPGEKGQYCNTCYNTLGLIIEKVSGMNYYDYMKTFLFQPLGMNNTGFGEDLQKMNSVPLAKEYSWFYGFRNTSIRNFQAFGKSQDPEGGIYTNALDLAKFVSATLGSNSVTLLNNKSLAFQGSVPTEEGTWKYTVGGFELGTVKSQKALYKGGDGIGSASAILMLPEEELGVVLMIGESNSEPKKEMAIGMMELLLGGEPQNIDSPAPLFKQVGYIMIIITLGSVLITGWVGRSIYARYKNQNKLVKHRWLNVFLSLILLTLSTFIGYVLFTVRPTQIGFYGYPFDMAVGLICFECSIILSLAYNIYLIIYGVKYDYDL